MPLYDANESHILGLNPEMHKNVTWNYHQAGHMMYIDSDSRAKLKKDMADFIQSALPTR